MFEYIIFVSLYVALCVMNVELVSCNTNNKFVNTSIKATNCVVGPLSWVLPVWIPWDLGMGWISGTLMYALQFLIATVAIMIVTYHKRN